MECRIYSLISLCSCIHCGLTFQFDKICILLPFKPMQEENMLKRPLLPLKCSICMNKACTRVIVAPLIAAHKVTFIENLSKIQAWI